MRWSQAASAADQREDLPGPVDPLQIVATTIFFGFYLWLVDLGCTKLLAQMLRQR